VRVARLVCSLCVAVFLFSGCLQPGSTDCGGWYCPPGLVCAPDSKRCASPAQLSACQGKAEGAPCSAPGAPLAECLKGVCTAQICGDGITTGDEVCDDGNLRACDGCSADCRSDETCGNGTVDCQEQCDQGAGNSDRPNELCRPDCRRQRCGDGIVDGNSGEDCDGSKSTIASCTGYGFYGGELSCSPACRNDTSSCVGSCGDGQVNGVELCDGLPPTGQDCLDFGYDVGNLQCTEFCTPSFARCGRLGFQPMKLNLSVYLFWIWGVGPNDVYAAGDTGVLLHFDGSDWSEVELGIDWSERTSLNGAWGSGPNDIFVVGGGGTVIHFDGAAWSLMDSGTSESLKRVWGRGINDVYAVGTNGTLLHYDGTSWSRGELPISATLWSVWGASPNDLYAVGDSGTFLHYDGSAWSAVRVPLKSEIAFYGVWGLAADDIYAVGEKATILHYDGSNWSIADQGQTAGYLQGLWGTGANDVYASGSGGVLRHYDGSGWSDVSSGTTQDLFAIWGSGSDDLFALGPSTVVHFGQSGPTLTQVDSGTPEELYSAWGTSMSDVTAVGGEGTIQHFDGSSWTGMKSPTREALNWIWGSGSNDQFAVGAAGTIVHFDGARWIAMDSPTQASLNGVWGSGAKDVYAVGEDGTFLHYDGSSWSLVDTSVRTYFYNIWGSGPGDVFIAGGEGTILHYDGRTLEPMRSDTSAEIWGVWGSGANDVFALADVDGALHYDGHTWSKLSSGPSRVLDYGAGSSPNDVFALASFSTMLSHYDGLDWAPIRLPRSSPALFGLWMTREGGYLVGAFGAILRLDRHCAAHELNCRDRWDNDCDGLVNCADPDCAGDAVCVAGGLCHRAKPISCGTSTSEKTLGASPSIEVYACSERVENGPETYHRFSAPKSGKVTIELSEMSADLDLIVLAAGPSGGCDPRGQCVAASTSSGVQEALTFSAEGGQDYFIVVDGRDGAAGTYTLQVRCP